jgi:hypothetical protein
MAIALTGFALIGSALALKEGAPIRHPMLGPLAFEFSTFAVDGRTDLAMVVYNLATPEDAEKIKSALE